MLYILLFLKLTQCVSIRSFFKERKIDRSSLYIMYKASGASSIAGAAPLTLMGLTQGMNLFKFNSAQEPNGKTALFSYDQAHLILPVFELILLEMSILSESFLSVFIIQ